MIKHPEAMVTRVPSANFRKIRLGDIIVYSLSDGLIERPLQPGIVKNAEADEVRAALSEAGQSDAVVTTPFTAMALVRDGNITLIDSGTGGFAVYGPHCGYLGQSLAAAGLDRTAVRTVLLTHLHGDHIYGLFDPDTLEPKFPDAEVIVPAEELRWWTQPGVDALDLGPTRVGLAARIRKTLATWSNVHPFDGEAEVLPGVFPVPAYGHSPGHTAYLVQTGAKDLLISADVCVNPFLYLRYPEWQAVVDQDPPMAVSTRRRVFDRSASEGLLVTGTHWELPNIGTIKRSGSGYLLEPIRPDEGDGAR